MKLYIVLLLTLVLAGFNLLPAAYASPQAVQLTPIADDMASNNDSALNTETPLPVGGSADPGGSCISQYETFLKFDLSSIPVGSTLSSATLTLRSIGSLAGSTAVTLRLFGSTSDGWTEGSGQILWASKPSLTADLASTATGPVAAGQDIVFPSTPALLSFLQGQNVNGDRIATLAIQAIACNQPAARQYMASRETTGANGVPATLTIDGTTPTAVALSSLEAQQPAPNWPLYIGLAALSMLIVGLLFYRRRAVSR